MSPIYFETEGSFSVKRLYIQLWYGMFDMHQYKHCLTFRHRSTYIQGVTGGTDQTSGGCSLC